MSTSPHTATHHNNRRIIPVTIWNEYHKWPTLSGLRYFIFHAERNGFDKVIRRAGRRVLIDEEAFFKWIDKDAK